MEKSIPQIENGVREMLLLLLFLVACASAQQTISCANVLTLGESCPAPFNPYDQVYVAQYGYFISCYFVNLMVSECRAACPFNGDQLVQIQPAILSDPGFYNVRNFGAVCNNITDDTAAIQAAIDAAAAQSPPVNAVLIPGLCAVSSTISITNPIRLFGWDREACGLIGTNLAADILSIEIAHLTYGTVTVADMTVAHSQASAHISLPGTYGIHVYPGAQTISNLGGLLFQNLFFLASYNALLIDGTQAYVVSNCLFMGNGVNPTTQAFNTDYQTHPTVGVYVQNTVNPDAGDGVITGCYFEAIGYMVYQVSSGGLKINNNKFNVGQYGYYLNYSATTSDLFITANSFENMQNGSIVLTASIASGFRSFLSWATSCSAEPLLGFSTRGCSCRTSRRRRFPSATIFSSTPFPAAGNPASVCTTYLM